jgi:hypothetical protein
LVFPSRGTGYGRLVGVLDPDLWGVGRGRPRPVPRVPSPDLSRFAEIFGF